MLHHEWIVCLAFMKSTSYPGFQVVHTTRNTSDCLRVFDGKFCVDLRNQTIQALFLLCKVHFGHANSIHALETMINRHQQFQFRGFAEENLHAIRDIVILDGSSRNVRKVRIVFNESVIPMMAIFRGLGSKRIPFRIGCATLLAGRLAVNKAFNTDTTRLLAC